MSPRPALLLALLVTVAGCTGAGAPSGDATTSETTVETTTTDATEPHTADGTSHAGSHFSVRATYAAGNVTGTLAPDGDAASVQIDDSAERSFTREIHDRGHDVCVSSSETARRCSTRRSAATSPSS